MILEVEMNPLLGKAREYCVFTPRVESFLTNRLRISSPSQQSLPAESRQKRRLYLTLFCVILHYISTRECKPVLTSNTCVK
jgi:hypothetical protein